MRPSSLRRLSHILKVFPSHPHPLLVSFTPDQSIMLKEVTQKWIKPEDLFISSLARCSGLGITSPFQLLQEGKSYQDPSNFFLWKPPCAITARHAFVLAACTLLRQAEIFWMVSALGKYAMIFQKRARKANVHGYTNEVHISGCTQVTGTSGWTLVTRFILTVPALPLYGQP